MTYHVVALDNVMVRAEDQDHEALVLVGIFVNQYLEDNRDRFAKMFEDLVIFGTAKLVL